MTIQAPPTRATAPGEVARPKTEFRTVSVIERRVTHSRGRTTTHFTSCPGRKCGWGIHFDFSAGHQVTTLGSCGHFREVVTRGPHIRATFEIEAPHV